MITIQNLSFIYDGYQEECLKNVSFHIKEGEVVLLTGLSGSGKSTVLKCLNGLIPHLYEGTLSGKIFLDGVPLENLSAADINQTVGSVFQNPRSQFFTTSTISELAFAMENYGILYEEMKAQMESLSQRFDLEPILGRDIFQISSGERQRLSLACSFSLNPKILMFDEPSSNLDYAMTMKIGEYIKSFKAQGYTILVADHRYFYLNQLLDKIIVMEDGSVSGIYTEEEFKQSSYPLRKFTLFDTPYPLLPYQPLESCLEIKDLSYLDILNEVSLQCKKGEVTAILGKNGAGKTTLAKLICGMEKPSSGVINAPPALFVMQDSDYQLFGTSAENELSICPHPVSKEEIHSALEKVGLLALRYRHPFALSGGEKQRLQIATAMVSQNELLVFDEPTSGLDFYSMHAVSDLILSLAETKAVLVISHDYEFIRKTAHRIVYLADGCVKDDFILTESTASQIETIFQQMKGDSL